MRKGGEKEGGRVYRGVCAMQETQWKHESRCKVIEKRINRSRMRWGKEEKCKKERINEDGQERIKEKGKGSERESDVGLNNQKLCKRCAKSRRERKKNARKRGQKKMDKEE